MPDKKINMTKIMLFNYFNRKKSRLVTIFLSVVIGSATIAALTSVYLDIDMKMKVELRTYGANIIASKNDENYLTNFDSIKIKELFNNKKLVGFSPYLSGIAESNNERFVITGVDLDQYKKLSPYMRTVKELNKNSIDPKIENVFVGKSLAFKLNVSPGDELILRNSLNLKKVRKVIVSKIIESGDVEDDQVVASLSTTQELLDKKEKVNLINISYSGSIDEINKINRKLSKYDSNISLKPITKIAKSEGLILDKISLLTFITSLAILLCSTIATAITIMSVIFERRYEIGIKKAIGASNKDIISELASEGIIVGIFGGLFGWVVGIGLAQIIGISLFGSYISIRAIPILISIFVALILTSVPSVLPARMVLKIEPANVLRNE